MTGLSEAQKRTLRVFCDGATATTMRPSGRSWWYVGGHNQPNPRSPTLFALRDLGLVHADYSDWRWITWTVTPAGEAALAEEVKDG